MTWNLYLDDIRLPPPGGDWTIARDNEEAKRLILRQGPPHYASLDHDLGFFYCRVCAFSDGGDEACGDGNGVFTCGCTCHVELPNGLQLLKWMMETNNWPLTTPRVHSANPAGAANMRSYIASYEKSRLSP